MRYKTKVTVMTGGKAYKPGTILPDDVSKSDLAFLKSKNFLEPADVPASFKDEETDPEDDPEDDSGQEPAGFSGFDEMDPPGLKSPEEIRKIRSKKEVAEYAAAIGFNLGGSYEEKSLKDLQAAVIDFQEEMEQTAGEE